MTIFHPHRKQQGESLIELLVGILILTICLLLIGSSVFTGARSMTSTGHTLTRAAVAQRVAEKLAEAKISGSQTGTIYVTDNDVSFTPPANNGDVKDKVALSPNVIYLRYAASTADSEDLTFVFVTIMPNFPAPEAIQVKANANYPKP